MFSVLNTSRLVGEGVMPWLAIVATLDLSINNEQFKFFAIYKNTEVASSLATGVTMYNKTYFNPDNCIIPD